jgi:hypothetical protein
MQMSEVPIISGYEEDIIYEYIYYIKKLLKIIIACSKVYILFREKVRPVKNLNSSFNISKLIL